MHQKKYNSEDDKSQAHLEMAHQTIRNKSY